MTKKELKTYIKEGLFKGFFWSIGVTLGFAFVTTLLALILSRVDALPFVGNILANIVASTLESLGTSIPS
ncbi:hypothetical protein A2801_02700 [Candidatus Woesebacteria bacterium RIFCSPHIGHO2_01_FULL_41_10]|uniref:Uncharacterized protein n=1 Tax=Candidatus Woesebacteria bacterium RIFCSPHIGHO2_01_FULL_41_10 TaxID=1802500 RepID=A0A1F7YQF9_9BACT|nr:MAG: hypothetical protein A2801_02700 [Candidatus Woesebacteria bacterium RIFCSPHIGHO2_01_FULL_41_10]